jgi:hypothetical protein
MKFRHLPLFAAAALDRPGSASAAPPAAKASDAAADPADDEEEEEEEEEPETPAADPEPAPAPAEATVFDRARLLLTGKKELVNQLLTARAKAAAADTVAADLATARQTIGTQAAEIVRLNAEVARLTSEKTTVVQGVQKELATVGITPDQAPSNKGDATPTTKEEAAAAYAAETDPAKKRAIYQAHKNLLIG